MTLSGRFEGTFKLANLEQLGITEHTEHTLNAEVCTSLQYFVLNDAFQLLVFILSYCAEFYWRDLWKPVKEPSVSIGIHSESMLDLQHSQCDASGQRDTKSAFPFSLFHGFRMFSCFFYLDSKPKPGAKNFDSTYCHRAILP